MSDTEESFDIKKSIENNIAIWMLGTLLTGFIAGITTYKGALEIMDLQTISKDRVAELEKPPSIPPCQGSEINSVALPAYLGTSEIESIFTKIKSAYNKKDVNDLYQLLGPIRRAQLSLDTAKLQIEPTFQSLGAMESGFFVRHQFIGQEGIYKFFTLNFYVKYEKAEKGFASISVIDDGKTYQIDSITLNRL